MTNQHDDMKEITKRIIYLIAVNVVCFLLMWNSFEIRGALVFLMYMVTYVCIKTIGIPRALLSYLSDKEIDAEWKKGKLRFWIDYFPIAVYVIALLYTQYVIGAEGFSFSSADAILNLAVPYILCITASMISRHYYLKYSSDDSLQYKDISEKLYLDAKEEELENYVSVKSFTDLDAAEKCKAFLERHNIPSSIYGAVKPDYISRNNLPIQVVVRKRYEKDAFQVLNTMDD